ncbi:MAG: SDR family NAD(P)-dependent oxidoreductase [Muribaculaceae bacterium]|nr:SDR family NAD(P)-dependent oxidoreductase [Muribaculaceae bacterium]
MNKIVLVTGATSGIGHACAETFLKAGYNVIVTARRKDKLTELYSRYGENCLILSFDVCDRVSATEAISTLPPVWKNIDVLINNAGLALGLEPEYEGDYTDWDTMIDTNIKGLLTMTRLVVPGMVERNAGHIINIGSVAGDAAYANGNVYCATKAAVKSITDGLRIDVADTEIRVTLLKPGLVETNFSNVRFHGDCQKADKVYQGITPLSAQDIADAALYAVQAPPHVQIAEMLILATHQANGTVIVRQ